MMFQFLVHWYFYIIAYILKSSLPFGFHNPTRKGGDTKITPSPLKNSIGMFLFVVCWQKITEMYGYNSAL